jgi:hypothetical protein
VNVPRTIVDRSSLAAAMLAMAAARLSGALQVAGDQSSGTVWFHDGDVIFAVLTNDLGLGDHDADDPVLRAHEAILHTLTILFTNTVLTIHLHETTVEMDPADPRFDTLTVLATFEETHQPA